jgi:hypothetical protein
MVRMADTHPAPTLAARRVKPRAAALTLLAAFMVAFASPGAHAAVAKATSQPFNIVPITVDAVSFVNGQLVALVSLSGKGPQAIPITLTSPGCPILNLEIPQGIHLSVLGLNVDTSGICLSVTAQNGSLLCDLANAVSGGTLITFLSSLTQHQLMSLLSQLQGLLGGALSQLTSSSSITSVAQVMPSCSNKLLTLSIGPLDLTLLGLEVKLNNCANGPVTVTISTSNATLLGLICQLEQLINHGASLSTVIAQLRDIAQEILAIIAAA